MTRPCAIGFFDSGVGGLSVLRHAIDRVDGIPLLYVADSGFAPYGSRTAADVRTRCSLITRFLLEQGAEAIVVACNTATAVAVDHLRAEFGIPIIAMEPAIKPAARHTRSGRIGVLATGGTLRSDRYARLRLDHGQDIEVHERVCHHWVEAVEEGDLDDPRVHDLVDAELRPLHAEGVDTYVLGCTHFPFLRDVIASVVGPAAAIIDPGPAVIEQLRRRLDLVGGPGGVASPLQFFSSGSTLKLDRHLRELLGIETVSAALPC